MGSEISAELLGDPVDITAVDPERLVPSWKDQITIRAFVLSVLLGGLFCMHTVSVDLTGGEIPSWNIAAVLLLVGLSVVNTRSGLLSRLGVNFPPFTKQENTLIQTCIAASCSLAYTGADQFPGNRAEDVKNPGLLWMLGFAFAATFLGLFIVAPLRKVMVKDNKLTFPTGTAIAALINSYSTSAEAELGQKRFYLRIWMVRAFFWRAFRWLVSGVTLTVFNPMLASQFSPSTIGCGLIFPHIVSCSVLVGTILSEGLLWPFIQQHEGDWYPRYLGGDDLRGFYGYQVFIFVSITLGDGLYNLIKIIRLTIKEERDKSIKEHHLPIDREVQDELTSKLVEEKRRDEVFEKDKIPFWILGSGYVGLAAISTATIPKIFPPLKWYLVLMSYIVSPVLAFCCTYSTGLTDLTLSSSYGKIGVLTIASSIGVEGGGVLAGLAACGVIIPIVSTAANLMQDFKTGYLTLTSPNSILVTQLIGTAVGCIIAPSTFYMIWTFKDSFGTLRFFINEAVVLRVTAVNSGVSGFSGLPKHCLPICCAFFAAAVIINLSRDLSPKRISQFIPIPMAIAVSFLAGQYLAIDMFIGTVLLFFWKRSTTTANEQEATQDYTVEVASGLICGDGIWSILSM